MKHSLILLIILFISSCNFYKSKNKNLDDNIKYGIPDFIILNEPGDFQYQIFPGTIYEGSLIRVSIPIKNNGDNYKGINFPVSITITGLGNVVPLPTDSITFLKNDIKWYNSDFIIGKSGTYTLNVFIDPDSTVVETDKNNNSAEYTITVVKFTSSG